MLNPDYGSARCSPFDIQDGNFKFHGVPLQQSRRI